MSPTLLAAMMVSAIAAIPDGSLLVLRNSNKPVAAATGSEITHVAVVFNHSDTEWVYEATPAKVRRLRLAEYQRELGELNRDRTRPVRVSVLEPKTRYSELQIARMHNHAASQIGRRYSVKGYVRGKEFDGIHCAHFAAATLAASDRFKFEQACAISPAELIRTIGPLHKPPVSLVIKTSETDASWCERSWATWFDYGAWCRWACYETWTFCW